MANIGTQHSDRDAVADRPSRDTAHGGPGWDERARLAALRRYAILDTAPEPAFDDIARLAADVLEAPIAVVNLIAEDRQWFKAEIGIGARELPLDVSICAHAILQSGIFVVPDLALDERFRRNPLVTAEDGIRFYAGALLETPEGLPIGTVCVLDRSPRPNGITARQRLALEVLARQVMTQLELRRAISQQETRSREFEAETTERARAETAERESEERYRSLFNSLDAGFCVIEMKFDVAGRGTDYRFIEVNPAFSKHTGLVDAAGKWIREIVPAHEQHWFDIYGQVAVTGKPVRFENQAAALDNRWFDVHAFRVGDPEAHRVAILFNDITTRRQSELALQELNATLDQRIATALAEREQAQEALRQSQKMEAVGQLTGGIAHDFNNMLAVVIGGLNLLQRKLERGEHEVADYIESAMTGANRAVALTQRLLAFSRQQPLAPEIIDVNAMIEGVTELLARSLGETVMVKTALAPGLWHTEADPGQLESAILNLAVNARDAMPEGGTLLIETGNIEIDEHPAHDAEIEAGAYVRIAVIDTGTGMTPEVMAKAFDPFFTTKPVGKGTGLGLSQVFGFVRQSGGYVKAESGVGRGTTITIYLPRVSGEAKPAVPRQAASLQRGGPHEIVLVVEDEERVRSFSVEALRELGYTVIHAANGPQALRLIQGGQDVTLLFTDIVMPEMTGRQLAEQAVALMPHLKVIYTTGYEPDAVGQDGLPDPDTTVLRKPFQIEQLSAGVRNVLDGA